MCHRRSDTRPVPRSAALRSIIETVAARDFDYRAVVWTAQRFVRAHHEHHGIARSLAAYLDDCATLGDAWLARTSQWERQPEARSVDLTRRIRLLQSALMIGARGGTPCHGALDTLEQVHRMVRRGVA